MLWFRFNIIIIAVYPGIRKLGEINLEMFFTYKRGIICRHPSPNKNR